MHGTYLEVTFRGGEPLAAYFYLPRQSGDRSAAEKKHGPGLLVDLTEDGRPIGIEITVPATAKAMNEILATYGLGPISEEELAPLVAAA
jgi:hypothetical protein